MSLKSKRRTKSIVLVVITLVASVAAGALAVGTQPEEIDRLWTTATLDAAGEAVLTETIDYDFAHNERHGIYRTIPSLSAGADVTVNSPDAPDQKQVTYQGGETSIRIGDPNTTVSGQHRYNFQYPLNTLTSDSDVSWNAVGTEWTVGIKSLEAHLVVPNELTNIKCLEGNYGSQKSCDINQVEPGHLVVQVGSLSSSEGVTIYATRGAPLLHPSLPPDSPVDRPDNKHVNPFLVALVVAIFTSIGSIIATQTCRRAGREWVGVGGPADAAWGTDAGPTRRIDTAQLSELATIEFAPPKELTPAQGGVLLSETVSNNHKAAWIMQAGVDGYIDIEKTDSSVKLIRRTDKDGYANSILDQVFLGRPEITLGKYDSLFAKGWTAIGNELSGWQHQSGLWDAKAGRRVTLVQILGWLALCIFGIVATASVVLCGTTENILWVVPTAIGSTGFGAATAAIMSSSELRVLTPAGSGLWLRTESFRRFLEQCEAKHVEAAAKQGVLLEYTAWAVALGEVNHWTKAMDSASIPPELKSNSGSVGFLASAPYFASAASSASSAPSSSGGSSGGGSVGGGGGGGGGGSW